MATDNTLRELEKEIVRRRIGVLKRIGASLRSLGVQPYNDARSAHFIRRGRSDYCSRGALSRPFDLSKLLWTCGYHEPSKTAILIEVGFMEEDRISHNLHFLDGRLGLWTLPDPKRNVLSTQNRECGFSTSKSMLESAHADHVGDANWVKYCDTGLEISDPEVVDAITALVRRRLGEWDEGCS